MSYHVNSDEAYSLFNGSGNPEFDVGICRIQVWMWGALWGGGARPLVGASRFWALAEAALTHVHACACMGHALSHVGSCRRPEYPCGMHAVASPPLPSRVGHPCFPLCVLATRRTM